MFVVIVTSLIMTVKFNCRFLSSFIWTTRNRWFLWIHEF